MYTNKQVANSLEKQHLQNVRKYYLSIADINIALSAVHQAIMPQIDLKKYQFATDYIHQYISYTSVWNLKFVANLESPEVALLQIFHLHYIFDQEPKERFIKERALLAEQERHFYNLKPYKIEHMEKRKQKMLDYIKSHI
ncbi:hypothetical protein [Lysinibacillus odysseyi]|uniref:Uncharacterized protein n=1 Tax=Lysinibacillus odysseyi 34hs-1 = NBRC 100172 TaxID=1220589 RepID=A0A0A3ISM9_9BACI|nr:hypothetical protein [Lysinibacillus odysseyi]KGR85873.1 hypothetical protein CD32_08510 [Lysinibacillus odysseyi 34hs-1 = NBRC 100172]